jgi:hypothetical protein
MVRDRRGTDGAHRQPAGRPTSAARLDGRRDCRRRADHGPLHERQHGAAQRGARAHRGGGPSALRPGDGRGHRGLHRVRNTRDARRPLSSTQRRSHAPHADRGIQHPGARRGAHRELVRRDPESCASLRLCSSTTFASDAGRTSRPCSRSCSTSASTSRCSSPASARRSSSSASPADAARMPARLATAAKPRTPSSTR